MKDKSVSENIKSVKRCGDSALRRLTRKYDNVRLGKIEVPRSEMRKALKEIPKETLRAMLTAYGNIKKFSEFQMAYVRDFEVQSSPGVFLGQKIVPIEKIGVYIPGGKYPLFSTVFMTCIPARVAGVKEIILCSPPTCKGSINPLILAAAGLCGVDRIFRVGGAQAIAAMAYGTETVPKVDKIVGPGNAYVTEAKRQVFGEVGIDVLAGPSEVLVIADRYAKPGLIASELLAQLEHGKGSRAVLLTDSKEVAEAVRRKVSKECEIITTKTMRETVEAANRAAPEHLVLQVRKPRSYLPELRNYGSLFLGDCSSVVFGDYVSGTNHILPTGRASRYSEGVSVRTFIKQQTYQYITRKGFGCLADAAEELSEKEGLENHNKAVRIRRR